MARRRQVTFAETAIVDLEDIRAWYVDQGVPETGTRLVAELVAQAERLAVFPESGRVVPEFGMAALREVIHPPFRFVYRLDEGWVRVVRVWRSERLLRLPPG